MFNNVLFGDRSYMRKDENGKAIKDVPADKRNELQYELYKQYMPDVLGCQEFNITKRGERDIPHSDLVAMIKTLGYKESCPRDTKVHPFFNNTPLFYNTKTTKLIKSEYYWFKHQLDWQNEGRCSCRDCSSKSMTWGLFESLETGKRYIAVSVHMCTASAGVKRLQAIEAVEIFRELRKKYNCPIFIGGDYNALWDHPNYEYFTSDEVGYLDIGRNGVAELHSSEARTYHRPYPAYCEELDMVLPDEADDTAIDLAGGVDHILLDNGEDVKVKVYGVVVDEVAAAGSDHYPIFADFNV
jgi:endonuclease/exonuclease/phosphatase family metal-dependent hydrolase